MSTVDEQTVMDLEDAAVFRAKIHRLRNDVERARLAESDARSAWAKAVNDRKRAELDLAAAIDADRPTPLSQYADSVAERNGHAEEQPPGPDEIRIIEHPTWAEHDLCSRCEAEASSALPADLGDSTLKELGVDVAGFPEGFTLRQLAEVAGRVQVATGLGPAETQAFQFAAALRSLAKIGLARSRTLGARLSAAWNGIQDARAPAPVPGHAEGWPLPEKVTPSMLRVAFVAPELTAISKKRGSRTVFAQPFAWEDRLWVTTGSSSPPGGPDTWDALPLVPFGEWEQRHPGIPTRMRAANDLAGDREGVLQRYTGCIVAVGGERYVIDVAGEARTIIVPREAAR